jgi:DNA-binding SARP family transcriptional activator
MQIMEDLYERRLAPGAQHDLRVYVLGPSWIEWQGQPLSVHRRQARALLYCLATKMKPVPRDQICFGFWPDEFDAKSHRNLSHLLSHLREALPDPSVLRSLNDTLELDPQRVWCDAAAFREACSDLNFGNSQQLEQAIRLYRGPFLSGMSLPNAPEFELWVSEQRSACERVLLDALKVLISAETAQPDYGRAIQHARLYLNIDEMAEDVHRNLMVLHVLSGDRPAALQQYQRCVTILKRELGVDPLPETIRHQA